VPPTLVPDEVVEPLVVKVMNAPDEMMMNISEVYNYDYQEPPHSFAGFVCDDCGEMVVEKYGRLKGDKKVCIDCAVN